jgi:hypothetical protein
VIAKRCKHQGGPAIVSDEFSSEPKLPILMEFNNSLVDKRVIHNHGQHGFNLLKKPKTPICQILRVERHKLIM